MIGLRSSRTLALAALLAIVLVPGVFAQDAAEKTLTLDEVLALNFEARGGLDKIRAIKSARLKGNVNMGGMEAPISMEWKRPNKWRLEFTIQGQTGVQAFDGEVAWMHFPFMGQTSPEKMPEAETKATEEQADFEGPLVDYEKKGHQVEYLGLDDLEGTEVHKLKVTLESGGISHIYIDSEYNLEIKSSSKRTIAGQTMESSQSYSDFKEVDGLMMAFAMEISTGQGSQALTLETVDLDVELTDDHFSMPATEAPAASEGE